jgi:fructuronate reductase
MVQVASTLPRLSSASITGLPGGVRRFGYDRAKLETGIVHLGLGAFARAHICEFTDDVLARQLGPWGIAGVSMRRPDQRDRLAPQDNLYTTISREPSGTTARIIGCVTGVHVAAEAPEATLAAMTAPATRIVSLTVTEKGYCHDPATGRLQAAHPDIVHDLKEAGARRSAVGLVVAALAARRKAGIAPFTVLCCDNLPHNGKLVAALVRDFAALQDDNLAQWIERNGAFPSTMVDRIVPAATEADIALAAELTGYYDAAPVTHEPFRQWVIEDRFVDGARPTWHEVGAELVGDVAPFETMKLRLLNGAHSALAYLGYLGGHETIGDCVADPAYREFVEALWREEIIPATPPPPGTDLHAYAAALLQRFENPAIRHRTWQIAMDGSQKLPQRLLATIGLRLDRGMPVERLCLAVAGWAKYVGGVDEKGEAIDVRDPLAARLKAAVTGAADPAGRVAAVMEFGDIFGALAGKPAFVAALTKAVRTLDEVGARGAVAGLA